MKTRVECTDFREKWVLVDLQGEMQTCKVKEDGTLVKLDNWAPNGAVLGSLCRGDGKPRLVVGSHELQGEDVTLPKALAVMRYDRERACWDVCGRIERKLLFSKRPQPVLRNKRAASRRKINYGKLK